jgi:curved DNA-binding protein CbpA
LKLSRSSFCSSFYLLPRTSIVQIPLDFYRILGVPTRATPEQLQQAFEDRLQQLPRQEYSNTAIAARKQLLEEAFTALSTPTKRQIYDRQWADLEEQADASAPIGLPLDVIDTKLAGVLLLLQEIGAYQQILKIGAAYLERPIDLAQVPTSAGALESDVILAMALANLELGREQWQQSQFEAGGDSLQAGLTLLEKEQQFPDVQAEIRGDLYKLRPYRILELLNEAEPEPRTKGLDLLQAMLNDRDGIDGNQDDRSGLSVNDFLRFIQQLREYLTVAEQQELFEREAARPSAVASYLAVYALIARGVSEGKPDLVERGKTLLIQLGDRQDIAIELGMCWLLLGQPEAAHHSLMMSQDEESLNFMRQYSEGATDLIPGLYLYTENWLQQEVYPYFRDLADRKVSLQQYFDDPTIQNAIDELEPATVTVAKSGLAGQGATLFAKPSELKSRETASSPISQTIEPQASASGSGWSQTQSKDSSSLWNTDSSSWSASDRDLDAVLAGQASLASGATASQTIPKNQRRSNPKTPFYSKNTQDLRKKVQQRGTKNRPVSPTRRTPWVPWAIAALLGVGVVAGALALGKMFKPASVGTSVNPIATSSPETSATIQPTGISSPGISPSSGVSTAPSPLSSASAGLGTPSPSATQPSPTIKTGPLTQPDAKELVKSWQSAKAAALGQQYDTSSLKTVLAEPVRSQWEASATQARRSKGYWQYTLDQLDIQSVEPTSKDRAVVKAVVKESGQYFEQGKLIGSQSYKGDTYKVKYVAVRQNQEWLIQDMQVLR